MAKLMVDYDGLEQNKNAILREKDTFENSVKNLQNIISEIQENWVGESSNAYAEKFQDLKVQGLDKVSELLQEVADQLSQVCSGSDTFDRDMASQIKK